MADGVQRAEQRSHYLGHNAASITLVGYPTPSTFLESSLNSAPFIPRGAAGAPF